MAARHLDESIPLQYGIVGQETTGPGGMFKALRTIPAMLEIARTVEEVAPEAYILNYTNPSGIITEAVSKHSRARIIGLCSGIPGIQYQLKTQLEPRYADLRMYSVGLNHLGFIYRLVSDGQDVTREAVDFLRAQAGGDREWLELAHLLGAFPMRGYISLYYHHARRVQEMQARGKTRAQTVAEIEEQVFAEAAKTETASKPEALRQRGGGGYSDITFSVLKAIHHDMGEELVMSAPTSRLRAAWEPTGQARSPWGRSPCPSAASCRR
jgi:6-phospho-beta-glucosidase